MHRVIPNFVRTDVFRPDAAKRSAVRDRLGLADPAFVVVAVGALKRKHKRIDWLIREFGRLPVDGSMATPVLLLTGARTEDTCILQELAESVAPGRIRMMPDVPRAEMPGLLAAADVFVHGALFEMMPIAFLEAGSAGLPLVSHGHPVMQWMSGAGGVFVDMQAQGALAAALTGLARDDGRRIQIGKAAREHVEQMFAQEVVIRQYVQFYRDVLAQDTDREGRA